jgi:hypothetical protein
MGSEVDLSRRLVAKLQTEKRVHCHAIQSDSGRPANLATTSREAVIQSGRTSVRRDGRDSFRERKRRRVPLPGQVSWEEGSGQGRCGA